MKQILPFFLVALMILVGGYFALYAYQQDQHEEANDVPTGWERTSSSGLTYTYPQTLGTDYISEVEWPPVVTVVSEYSCTEGQSPQEVVEERNIGDRTYCVSKSVEGAAGSTYASHGYTTHLGSETVRLSFTLRYPQCANYDEPKMGACAAEEAQFDVDALADRIISTVSFE